MRSLILAAFLAAAFPLAAEIIDNVRGEQIFIRDKGTFTLWGVNLPPGPGAPFGIPAYHTLREYLARNSKVTCTYPGGKAAIFERNGVDVGLALIRMGLGWHDETALPVNDPRHREYAAAEAAAKSLKLGVWSEKNPPAGVDPGPRRKGRKRRR